MDAAGYLLAALPDPARDSDVNTQVLARAEAGGQDGPDAVSRQAAAALADLRGALPGMPEGHVLAVLDGIAIQLDDYLATRMVELVVHADDLVASAGIDPPALPAAGEAVAVRVLAEVARRRTSTAAMVTTLARRERAPAQVPRAF